MELRHLRCFIAVAEERHFARAAARLHIEQSPLSRTIRELEDRLGVRLFDRSNRRTELTWAGQMMLEEARRIIAFVEQAKAKARSAAAGYRGRLRIALSDGVPLARLTEVLARSREEEPEIEIALFEVPLGEQLRGLVEDLFDVGLTQSDNPFPGITAMELWRDPLMIAVPSRHPLLKYSQVPLAEVLNHPLVLCDPHACQGMWQQLQRLLRKHDTCPQVAHQVPTLDLMLALVAAGYGVGFGSQTKLAEHPGIDVVLRPLDDQSAVMTTYLLHRQTAGQRAILRLIDRLLPGNNVVADQVNHLGKLDVADPNQTTGRYPPWLRALK